MKEVWKFPLSLDFVGDGVSVQMPKGAEVLAVQVQRNVPCLWALVDTGAELEGRLFAIKGTGQDVGAVPKKYGTVQMAGGEFVFHVFEVLL